MIEKTARLYYKSVLKFYTNTEADDPNLTLFSSIVDVIYDYVTACAGPIAERRHYERHGNFSSADGMHKLTIASFRMFENTEYPFFWAMKYVCHELENNRRTWIIHIGIRQEQPDCLTLYFAQMVLDNLSGCLSFPRAPIKMTPAFLDMIMRNGACQCVTGGRVIPPGPMELTFGTLDEFLEELFDDKRELPVILCGCPYLLNPDNLYARVAGNVLLYYAVDIGVIIDLNDRLPLSLRIEYDATRVYMPMTDGTPHRHPQFTAHDIQAQGSNAVVSVFGQAYSESFRSSEWRDFITTDYIYSLRQDRDLTLAKQQTEVLEARVREQKSQITALEKQSKSLTSKLERSKNTSRAANARELESLLGECFREQDAVKAAVERLKQSLYQDMGKTLSLTGDDASPLAELEQAVVAYARSIMGRRGGR